MKCSELFSSASFFMRDMASKGKKGKKSKKQASSETISGQDFPKEPRDWRTRNKSWGGYGVSKSWRSVSKKCNSNGNTPQLQLISCVNHCRNIQDVVEEYGESQLDEHLLLKIPFLPEGFYTSCPKLSIMTPSGPYMASWINKILFIPSSTTFFHYIFGPPGGSMVLTGLSRPTLLFTRSQRQLPIHVEHLDCKIIDPYDSEKRSIIFINAIGFNGKFYALSLQGALAVLEQVDSSFTITGFGKNRAVPSVPSRRFIEYLIESNGKILMVFLISRRSISKIDYVEVFKLDLLTLSWVKMDNLGDRALFLAGSNHGLSVSANQVAYKSNHIYFTHQGINCWKEFDMESRTISPCCNF